MTINAFKTAEETCQYVTFMLADEMYGLSVHCVQSINEMMQITSVPGSSEYIEGVVNLRGSVVPVISLRKKFNLSRKEYDLFTVILIVEVNDRLIGLIVDSVSDVISLPVAHIQREIKFSAHVDKASIEGIGKFNEQLIIFLDVENLIDYTSELDGTPGAE